MNLSQRVEFLKPIGIENTFVSKRSAMKDEWGCSGWRNRAQERLKDVAAQHLETRFYAEEVLKRASQDPGCVEVPSPILTSWKQAKAWYETVTELADKAGLTTFREGFVAGGGHIHMGQLHAQVVRDMFRDMAFRPYVAWAFLDPVDDINGKSLLSEKHVHLLTPKMRLCYNKDVYEWEEKHRFISSRSGILHFNLHYDTVEWRAFDSACDWETQEQHIAVYQRYVSLFLKNKYRVHGFAPEFARDSLCIRDLLASWRDKDKCVKAFREFITHDLELPWRGFRWYVDRNLIPKLEKGWSQVL